MSTIQGLTWSECAAITCPVCFKLFNEKDLRPMALGCGHTVCKFCVKNKFKNNSCPFDKFVLPEDADNLPANFALLPLVETALLGEEREEGRARDREESDGARCYQLTVKVINQMATYLKPLRDDNSDDESPASDEPPAPQQDLSTLSRAGASATPVSEAGAPPGQGASKCILSRPMQRKLISLLHCQLLEDEGRARSARIARSMGERIVSELLSVHQLPHQLSANLWAAVRTRGCQFLGPAMQEEVLRLILLALEDGSFLSRKVLVMFVVQKLEATYPQASKTAIGHVVQLLYRASCFKVMKRDEESSLMQLKSEFCQYEALRREHDAQIVQIALEAGLRISPEQWSSLLYGDPAHKSHMQSIIDKHQSSQTFSQSVTELMLCLQRSSDNAHLQQLQPQMEFLAVIDPNPECPAPSWENLHAIMRSLGTIMTHFAAFLANPDHKGHMEAAPQQNARYKTSMCRDFLAKALCPRGNTCTFAHSQDELERYRSRSRRSRPLEAGVTGVNQEDLEGLDCEEIDQLYGAMCLGEGAGPKDDPSVAPPTRAKAPPCNQGNPPRNQGNQPVSLTPGNTKLTFTPGGAKAPDCMRAPSGSHQTSFHPLNPGPPHPYLPHMGGYMEGGHGHPTPQNGCNTGVPPPFNLSTPPPRSSCNVHKYSSKNLSLQPNGVQSAYAPPPSRQSAYALPPPLQSEVGVTMDRRHRSASDCGVSVTPGQPLSGGHQHVGVEGHPLLEAQGHPPDVGEGDAPHQLCYCHMDPSLRPYCPSCWDLRSHFDQAVTSSVRPIKTPEGILLPYPVQEESLEKLKCRKRAIITHMQEDPVFMGTKAPVYMADSQHAGFDGLKTVLQNNKQQRAAMPQLVSDMFVATRSTQSLNNLLNATTPREHRGTGGDMIRRQAYGVDNGGDARLDPMMARSQGRTPPCSTTSMGSMGRPRTCGYPPPCQPMSQPLNQPVGQPLSQPVGQPPSHSLTQPPPRQPMSQPPLTSGAPQVDLYEQGVISSQFNSLQAPALEMTPMTPPQRSMSHGPCAPHDQRRVSHELCRSQGAYDSEFCLFPQDELEEECIPMPHASVSRFGPISRMAKAKTGNTAPVQASADSNKMTPVLAVTPLERPLAISKSVTSTFTSQDLAVKPTPTEKPSVWQQSPCPSYRNIALLKAGAAEAVSNNERLAYELQAVELEISMKTGKSPDPVGKLIQEATLQPPSHPTMGPTRSYPPHTYSQGGVTHDMGFGHCTESLTYMSSAPSVVSPNMAAQDIYDDYYRSYQGIKK